MAFTIKKVFDTPSRAYKENVGDEYDSWTDDGVLEYYWGEHIHLGYYTGALPYCAADIFSFCIATYVRHHRSALYSYAALRLRQSAATPAQAIGKAADAEAERQKGYKRKDFKQAKLDFVDEMLKWSGAKSPSRVLDVGCGIGGTTRILAKNFPSGQVQGTAAQHVVLMVIVSNDSHDCIALLAAAAAAAAVAAAAAAVAAHKCTSSH